ncbi:hypothetical protein DRO64_07835 [Candidatus Bathyarchaeota archaeon]|nr:MAG: hypothetical protein DRO64_07835 [Candidatus Bathyarchaeota archaeon]
MSEIEIKILNLQRLVTKEEIMRMRLLRKEGLSIPKIARIMKRSPATVSHYLKSEERMGRKFIPVE